MAASNKPVYNVFSVEEREGQDPFWLKIGTCFEHKDGKGFNLILNALPLDNRLVLRVPSDEQAQDAEKRSEGKTRGRNRRNR